MQSLNKNQFIKNEYLVETFIKLLCEVEGGKETILKYLK